MPRKKSVDENKIEPSNFDLAVVEVVNYIDNNTQRIKLNVDVLPNQKEILAMIGINYTVWPQMVNHLRHVTTKTAKQIEIVKKLRERFLVNPNYIWNYPHEKEMFIVNNLLVSEDEMDYGVKMPGSARLLKKELRKSYSENETLRSQLTIVMTENKNLKEDISNLRLLLSKLKTAKNPAK